MVRWWSRPGWAALGAVLVAILFAIGHAMSYGVGDHISDCGRTPPKGIEAELEVFIKNERSAAPQATASMLVDLPGDDGLARDLLHLNRDDHRYMRALHCVLGMPMMLWHRKPPSVTKEGDRILVRAETFDFIPLVDNGLANVGPLAIRVVGSKQWQATIREPRYLALARWRKISVAAPSGWLSNAQPDASAQLIRWERQTADGPGAATERIHWERPALYMESGTDVAGFTIHPDVRTRITAISRTPQWVWVPDLLYSLSALLLVGILVLWAHRDRATFVRRMCLPILMVAAAMTVAELGTHYGWMVFWPLPLVPPALLILAAAALWGVPWWAWLSIGLQALFLMGYSPALARLPDLRAPMIEPRDEVAAWSFLAFQLSVVLAVGMINAVRVLLSKGPRVRPPAWAWWCGVACAAILAMERFVNIRRFIAIPWAGRAPNAGIAASDMMFYPGNILNAVQVFLPVLAVIGVWALIRKRVEDRKPIEDRYVVLLFLMGSTFLSVAPFGLWLPVWPLALLVLWLWLRDQRTLLDTPLAQPGSTVWSVIDSHSISELRAASAQWGRIRQRGRALDRDLAKGTIALDAHAEETQRLLDIDLLPKANASTVRQLRAENVSPVDMILALGPGVTPWENAKWGIKIVALTSIPATALGLWLQWRTNSPTSSYSDVLDWTGIVAWKVTAWLAAGAVLGLLWQRLRFRRGIAKALPLVTAYAAAQLVSFATEELTGGNSVALVDIALFTAVITFTALLMDMTALRTADSWWSRRRHALAAAYGMENLSTQVAFVATQTVAVFTIVSLIQSGIADRPSGPSSRPPAGVQGQAEP